MVLIGVWHLLLNKCKVVRQLPSSRAVGRFPLLPHLQEIFLFLVSSTLRDACVFSGATEEQ